MSEPLPEPEALPARVLDAVAAGLWPSLSTHDRRDRARRALGLRPCGEWPGAGMVYIETERRR